jgi:hypothetical protein
MPILAPLPNIAMHVVKPPSIGELVAYEMSAAVRVLSKPGVIT